MSTRTLVATATLLILLAGCANDNKTQATAGDGKLAMYKPSAEVRSTDPVYAYLDAARADLKRGKVKIFNEVMQLSPAESNTFWPMYHDYEEELYTLGDQRLELTKRYVAALRGHTLDNAAATEMGNAWWDYETKRLELVKKYYQKVQAELSPVRAAQFAQIEHRTGLVVDLVAASETPLIAGEY